MRIFIQAIDYNMWSVIVNGLHIPTHTINNLVTLKPEIDWDDHDRRMAQLNAKVINVLYCAFNVNEFNRISTYNSAKEIWDRLEVTHEGTSQIKESKISILVYKYELFKMEPNESILGMYARFTNIVNN